MHFYEKTDAGVLPQHFTEMTSRPGQLRPTRMTDVRKWWREGREIVPSVTTVLNVLAKPALVNWKIDQHLKQAFSFTYDRGGYVSADWQEDNYIQEIKRLTELEMDKAPGAGSDLHTSLQNFVIGNLDPHEKDYKLCCLVMSEIEMKANIDYLDCDPEKSFVANGYGGQIDLVSEAFEPEWIIDYKTKQTADKFKPGKMVWDEHKMQLAAYRMGLDLPNARCANVFICLENGEIDFHEHTQEQLAQGWALFQHCLAIWNLQNR